MATPAVPYVDAADYEVVIVDMWGCAYGRIDGAVVTQCEWQLDDVGSATFTFPIIQPTTVSTFGINLAAGSGFAPRDVLPYSCIPGGREVQIWRNQELIWWGVPVTATPSATLVTVQCQGLLWWVNEVLFGPTLTESLIDGDFEVSGALGYLTWTPVNLDVAELVDANTGAPGVVTGRWAAGLSQGAVEADAFIYQTYVTGEVFDGQPVTVTGWCYIDEWDSEPLEGRGIVVTLDEHDLGVDTQLGVWTTQLTADMPVGESTQLTVDVGPLDFIRSHLPGVSYTLTVRLYCPQGVVVWDDVHVSVAAAPFTGTADQLMVQLLEYAQDPAQGKSTFAMPTNVVGTPPTDVLVRDYLNQSANSSVYSAFAEFIAEQVLDYEVTWDATGHFRTFTIYCPSKGSMQYNYPLTIDEGTVTQLAGSIDGSQVATTQRWLGQGPGGQGNEYAFRAFGGFLASGRGAGFPGGTSPRVVYDGQVTPQASGADTLLTSLSAAFTTADQGLPVTCLTPGVFPPGSYIQEVINAYSCIVISGDTGLQTTTGGSYLTVAIGGFTIEQSNSAQTGQPPGTLAGLAQGWLLRDCGAQPLISPRVRAGGSSGTNGLLGNVSVGDIIPVSTNYGWLTISGDVEGEPVLMRLASLTLYPVTGEIQPTVNAVNSALGGTTVVSLAGIPLPYAGPGVPPGFVLCDGSQYSPATYPSLFAAIGYTWGTGSGSNFLVPDLRGRTLFGVGGTIGGSVGYIFGSRSLSLSAANIPELTDTTSTHSHFSADDSVGGGRSMAIELISSEGITNTGVTGAVTFQTASRTSADAANITVGEATPTAVDPVLPPAASINWILQAF